MREYKVFRDEKGELTFWPHDEVIYTVRTSTDKGAQEAIRMLKRAEKQNKEQDGV